MAFTIETAAGLLDRPLLQENPFPEAITSRNQAALERLTCWAKEQHAGIESDMERFRGRPGPDGVADWELSALEHAVRTWRVFEAFRQLHEQGWCPALLFRLSTKTDFSTLCDPAADSSTRGFTDRVKKTLARRGIDDRFKWAEARRRVGAMGLLGAAGKGPDENGMGPEERQPEEGRAAPASAGQGPARGAADPLPALRLDSVWERLPSFTKGQLEEVYKRLACGLWTQFGDRFYSSFKKKEMLDYVRRLVRFHASLEAVQHLSEAQVGVLFGWIRSRLAEKFQRDDDLRIAARLYGDLLSVEKCGRLSADAWHRYRDAEVRRIGAFCFHLFLEDQTGA